MSGRASAALWALLLAAGVALLTALIVRGALAPREPARMVAPGAAAVRLEPGRDFLVLAEREVVPRAAARAERRRPQVSLTVRQAGAASPLRLGAPSRWQRICAALAHGGGALARFHASSSGDGEFLVEAAVPAGRPSVVLAFAPAASPGRLLWLLLGFGGQICFSMRFLVQWLASERAGRSTVPRSFWRYSLAGGLMILAYAAHTRDPVFILAYAFNVLVYARNLMLLRAAPAGGNAR